jgi:sister-chromatid-cohesion protein PDS5
MDTEADWVEDDDVAPRLRARILALKVCRNRCLAHASTDTALEVATPVLKMLSTLIDHGGSYSADATDESVFTSSLGFVLLTRWMVRYSPKVKSRMRLQAAISLLHLSVVNKFANAINTNFISLAITVQVCISHCITSHKLTLV